MRGRNLDVMSRDGGWEDVTFEGSSIGTVLQATGYFMG